MKDHEEESADRFFTESAGRLIALEGIMTTLVLTVVLQEDDPLAGLQVFRDNHDKFMDTIEDPDIEEYATALGERIFSQIEAEIEVRASDSPEVPGG